MSAFALTVNSLTLKYGAQYAVREASWAIPAGQVSAIIGPSGCGKTSFLKCLNRMIDTVPGAQVSGAVWFDGRNILEPHADVVALRMRVGMLFQKPNPFPKSLRENILFAPRLQRALSSAEAEALVECCLRDVGLWDEVKDRLHMSASHLSGGQQQRLCLARALAVGPEVLLMDEPCSALDPLATEVIEDLIRDLRGRLTVVIVTHNLAQARRVADRAAFFHLGELVEEGGAEQLFTQPRDPRTQGFVTGRFG